jgi:hypothetical protein
VRGNRCVSDLAEILQGHPELLQYDFADLQAAYWSLWAHSRLRECALTAERQQAAERLADLKVQQADVDAQRARVTAEAGPALYLAKLFGSNDTEAIVRVDHRAAGARARPAGSVADVGGCAAAMSEYFRGLG